MRPVDAATLIILRERREVLMGVRAVHHVFMPDRWVFPGGRVDPGDSRVRSATSLSEPVEARLIQSVTRPRARGLAMAAIRETFEETGLVLGAPRSAGALTRSPHWRPFFATGMAPALDKLHYFARAVTPPGLVRRFDARFFVVDARHMCGNLVGNGELEDLRWVGLDEVETLNLATITRLVLQLLQRQLEGGESDPRNLALYRRLYRRELFAHHPLQLP
jgi:8-oxo-dGTP pyrophosphatase MutT (NUDIX family)